MYSMGMNLLGGIPQQENRPMKNMTGLTGCFRMDRINTNNVFSNPR